MKKYFLFILMTVMPIHAFSSEKLSIVTTIKPIQSLVSSITEGVTDVDLLLKKNDSPHDFSMKPSIASKIYKADIVILVDRDFENFMQNILDNKEFHGKVIDICKDIKLKLLPSRSKDLWSDDEEHDHEHENEEHHHGDTDYHVWLDINNAKAITNYITSALSKYYPEKSDIFYSNAKKLIEKLDLLDVELKKDLTSYDEQYIVFHDAYQYFEDKYELNAIGSITINPSLQIGPKKLKELKKLIKDKKIVCMFREPQFTPKFIDILEANTGVKTGILDAEWGDNADNKDPKESYFIMMRNLSRNIRSCIDSSKGL